MAWTLGKKIGGGFGLVLLLLAVTVSLAFLGVNGIVKDAHEVIKGNELDGTLAQIEVDHLNFTAKITSFLTDTKVTELKVKTDPHKCGLGLWYYGEGRKLAEVLVPSMAPLLRDLEAPHVTLHHSAAAIAKANKQVHPGLLLKLADIVRGHLDWVNIVTQRIAEEVGSFARDQDILRTAVQGAISQIDASRRNTVLGDVAARKAAARAIIKQMRYGSGNKDYMWVQDINARMVMHPIKPQLDGRDLSSTKDSRGRLLFAEFSEIAKADGSGFVAYYWPKPGSDKPQPKLAYVQHYKPWGWVVGSGIYLDENDKASVTRAFDLAAGVPFSLNVQLDPTKCGLGRFLLDPKTKKLADSFPALKRALDAVVPYHNTLHASARKMETLINQHNVEQAMAVYHSETVASLAKIKQLFDEAIAAEDALQKSAAMARAIYSEQTQPSLHKVQDLLHKIRAVAKQNIMSDKVMLDSARATQTWVSTVGVVAILLGIVVAWFLTRSITQPVGAAVSAIKAAADGDFTFHVDKNFLDRKDEMGQMLRGVEVMSESLSNTVSEVIIAADTVASSADQISQGNQDLSDRTQQQASAIEETASALEEMTSSVKHNAENANVANDLARQTTAMAKEGDAVVEKTVTTMAEVTQSSRKIADIINVVNEIAFQTNLLALNAAVEAARAGEAGRGFAVVAGEVRNLAGRSASAAKEIQALITESVGHVDQGNEMVEESGKLLSEIIENVGKVADTIAEVTAASQEQASGIEEINRAIAHMDDGVQQNAAMVEEAASASEEMAAVAEELRSQMSQFKIAGRPTASRDTRRALPPAREPAPQPAAAKAKPASQPKSQTAGAKADDDFFGADDLDGFEEF